MDLYLWVKYGYILAVRVYNDTKFVSAMAAIDQCIMAGLAV